LNIFEIKWLKYYSYEIIIIKIILVLYWRTNDRFLIELKENSFMKKVFHFLEFIPYIYFETPTSVCKIGLRVILHIFLKEKYMNLY
jgi:hypothetical protein